MLYLGVDVGSLTCDAALVDEAERFVACSVVPTGARNAQAISRACSEVLEKAGIGPNDVAAIVATGYGRERVEGRDSAVTEITCHARGIRALLPGTDLVVDIGGQDSKAVRLDRDGLVAEFAMNDKCAAGTGRFLEAMARALEVDVDDLGDLEEGAHGNVTLSSMCTVFAESEVVSLIADGAEVCEIVHGFHRSIALRTLLLVKRIARDPNGLRVAMSGGVARNPGVVRALGGLLNCDVAVPPEPDIVGALGAALIARERATAVS